MLWPVGPAAKLGRIRVQDVRRHAEDVEERDDDQRPPDRDKGAAVTNVGPKHPQAAQRFSYLASHVIDLLY